MTPNRDERGLSSYFWRFQKLGPYALCALFAASIRVVHPGFSNPGRADFTHAKIWIRDTLWACPVEHHQKASYWYHPRHHADKSYDSIIPHVVWDFICSIFRLNFII